jgi:hypothetical protein
MALNRTSQCMLFTTTTLPFSAPVHRRIACRTFGIFIYLSKCQLLHPPVQKKLLAAGRQMCILNHLKYPFKLSNSSCISPRFGFFGYMHKYTNFTGTIINRTFIIVFMQAGLHPATKCNEDTSNY